MEIKVITVAAFLLATTYICSAQTMDSGTGAPSSSVGNNGDLYHRTDVPSVYGPKASGAWPSTFSYIVGQGCTTAYHLDKDCDGYGVGPTTITTDPNPLFGPDADDSDATVNTPASVVTKYGSINAFLTHLGFPTNRVFYIDPNSGVDASGCGTVTSPCQHFSYSAIGTVLNDGAGGTVMYRAGSSGGLQICTGGGCYFPHASSSLSPVVIMAYPGEHVTFLAANAPINGGGGSDNASTNVIFSGFSLIASSIGLGYGVSGSWVQNITLENCELAGWSMAVQFSAGSQNVTLTNNLFHDINEHAIYPVTGDQGQGVNSTSILNCSTWTWQPNNTNYNPHFNFNTTNNVILFAGSGGFDAVHYNGEMCGGSISGNILIAGGGTAIGLQDGDQNITVSNNLVANNSSAQILLYIYGCENNGSAVVSGQIGVSCDPSTSVGTVYYPNMEANNKIINNTLWTGQNPPRSYFCGPNQCEPGSYGIEETVQSEGVPGGRYVKNTTIQNNAIVTYSGGGSNFYNLFFDISSYPETNTMANNLLWNAYTGNSSADAMQITSNSLSCSAAPWYCAGSSTGTYGSGSSFPGTYSFTAFQGYNTGSNTNELWGNPTFADVQASYSTTPNMFNFRLRPGSPAIGAGLARGAPSTDITGATRASTPSIGAYEYTAVTALISLACTPPLVTAGLSATCTVSLPQPAGAGGAVIAVSSSSSAVVVPASVTVAAGSSSTTFSAMVGSGGVGQTVVLSAAFNGATETALLTFASAAATLTSLACSPATVASGATATCNLTLLQPAGSGGITVNLSSNMASVTVPATIAVAASSATAQFSATAGTVSSTQSATISAQYNGASVSATVSVQPPAGTTAGGWADLGASTQLQSVCPPDNYGGMTYAFNYYCVNVMAAWSGAAADTIGNRLIIWGGGGPDYYGNEVYSLNVGANPPTVTRLTNPSVYATSGCPDANADGTPASRHSYNDLVFLPGPNRVFSLSGRIAPCDGGTNHTWTLDLSVTPPVWHAMDPVNGFDPRTAPVASGGVACAYDPNTTNVICAGPANYILSYDFNTNTYTKLNTGQPVAFAATAVIDPVHKLMIFMGPQYQSTTPVVQAMDISSGSTFTVQDWSSQVTGCDILASTNYPGLAYDAALGQIVGYPNTGSTVYLFNTQTMTCVPQTFANGPTWPATTNSSGTFGRFQYFPSLNAFAVVEYTSMDAFSVSLSSSSAPIVTPLTCDLNGDGVVNHLDVQIAVNQALGIAPCTNADLQQNGTCTVIDVQIVVNASLGGACVVEGK